MKKKLSIVTVFLILFTSCSNDSDEDQKRIISLNENNVITEAILKEGLQIDNSIIETGEIKSNSDKNFNIDEDISAFLNYGFDLNLSLPHDSRGIYLNILSEDLIPSNNYYDIKLSNPPSLSKEALESLEGVAFFNRTIRIGFNETMPPGNFCCLIYVYDVNNDISKASKICVKVEEWGGNPDMIGTWRITKGESNFDGEVYVTDFGENLCKTDSIKCKDIDNTIEAEVCVKRVFEYTFKDDGEFIYNYDENFKELDKEKSAEMCKPVNSNFKIQQKGSISGKWAYDEQENEISVIFDESTDHTGGGFLGQEMKIIELNNEKLQVLKRNTDYFFNKK